MDGSRYESNLILLHMEPKYSLHSIEVVVGILPGDPRVHLKVNASDDEDKECERYIEAEFERREPDES